MIDKRFIGHSMPAFSAVVEAGRLRFFAKAIGQTDPVYRDETAARAAGHPGLPVPPTFLFCLEMESPDPAAIRNLLGMDYRTLLHGEQGFTFHAMAYAGDTLTFQQRIHDILRAANIAGRCRAHLDEVFSDGMLVIHGVERHHAFHVRRSQFKQRGDFLQAVFAHPAAFILQYPERRQQCRHF